MNGPVFAEDGQEQLERLMGAGEVEACEVSAVRVRDEGEDA